jgi:hypothetical protein
VAEAKKGRQMLPLDEDSFFDGSHWTGWSDEYGCPNVVPTPFGETVTDAVYKFCRSRGLSNFNLKPEAVQYRFCTLPEKNADRPWNYGAVAPAFNAYPTANKKIMTFANPTFPKLDAMNALLVSDVPASFDDSSIYAGPTGQDEKLEVFKNLMGGADYNARLQIYNDPEEYSSKRIACDPRLEEAAKDCFDDAFNADGDFTGTFCTHINDNKFAGFDLETIRQRQIDSNSGDPIPATLTSEATIGVNLKDSIIANIVLLIESMLEDGLSSDLTAHIPEAYTFFRSNKRVCDPQCPVPSEWSSWTCHCSKSGEANPDNLVDCQCGNQTRSRIQTCTIVEGYSCEIYHEGLTPFINGVPDYAGAAFEYNTQCDAYGYANYLDNKFQSPVYRSTGNLKNIIDYLGTGTMDSLVASHYPGPHAESQCFGNGVVSETMFRNKLADRTLQEFTYAREENTCAATNVQMISSETECTKTCGCGTYTKSYSCVYKGGENDGLPVPKDDDDYTCGCQEKPDEIIACNIECCPEWHQCDDRNCNEFTENLFFSPGTNFRYEVCAEECGEEVKEGELRCMCANTCFDDYNDDVILDEVFDIADVFTEHDWKSCAANVKLDTDVVTDNGDDVDYRITRLKECNHPCCVVTQENANNCPTLDCDETSFSLPWNIDYEKCQVSTLPKTSKSCVCDTTGTSTTKFCTDATGQYVEGDIFGADPNAEMCEYTRGEYIAFNEILSLITGKADADAYYCCNELNEQFLFNQWGEWGACTIDGVDCGCVNVGDDNCGMRTRKRDLKCPEFQIDETHCPCVEVEKCHLPVCPSGGVPKATQSCKLSATKTDHFDYGVSQAGFLIGYYFMRSLIGYYFTALLLATIFAAF